MWDLGMQPSLTALAAEFADVLSLLVLLCVALVGLAASLVILEAVHYYKFHRISSWIAVILRKKGDIRWQKSMN